MRENQTLTECVERLMHERPVRLNVVYKTGTRI